MTADDIIDRLAQPGVSAERLLEECRGPDAKLWHGNAKLYRAFTRKLLDQGYPARALDLAREGHEFLKDDRELQFLLAFAARRGGNPRYAQSLLQPLLPIVTDPQCTLPLHFRVEVMAQQGAILKLLSRTSPELRSQSAEWYERAANLPGARESPDAGTYPLINAATMWRMANNLERSQELAAEVIRRMAMIAVSNRKPLWYPATLGEAHLLTGDHDIATRFYLQAVTDAIETNNLGNLTSVRANIELLRSVGVTADSAFLDEHLGSVVVFSGHMADSPERQKAGHPARFPNSAKLIEAVRIAIRQKLDEVNAKVGFCSLACGGDLLFAHEMLARQAELHIVLPFAEHDFMRTSVTFGQTSEAWRKWRGIFDEVLDAVPHNQIRYATHEPYLGCHELFDFSNRVQQGLAVMRARERATLPQAVLLLDRSMTGQSGGARDYAEVWSSSGYLQHEIDLRSIREHVDELPTAPERPAAPLAKSKVKRQVRSILFADVAGFSRIPEWQLADFLDEYGRYLHSLFAHPIGKAAIYANTWGDGIYAVFETAVDAANFALELVEPQVGQQPKWSQYDLGESAPFRVGLHCGPVFELPELFQGRPGFGGQHVNRAARIEPATVQGCAYASEPFAAVLTMDGVTRFHIESVGRYTLAKDYDRCTLYRIARGLCA